MKEFIINKQPDWAVETISCLIDADYKREKEIIEHSEKFGLSEDDMRAYLEPIMNYKKEVLKEVLPIFEQFPRLKPYINLTEYEKETGSQLLGFVMQVGNRLFEEQTSESIDTIFNKGYSSLLDDSVNGNLNDNVEECVISNITDVITSVSKLKFEGDFKIRLIELYSERHQLWEDLKNFLTASMGICEKHFSMISKEFNETVLALENTTDFKEIVDATQVLTISSDMTPTIIPSIVNFNQLSVHCIDDGFYCHIGIYVLSLIHKEKENKLNYSDLMNDLKALSDATRIKILQLLSEQRMYIGELANVLNLTSATVSHHINILLQSELVSITMDVIKSKKIYYEVNEAKLSSIGDAIKNLGKQSSEQLPKIENLIIN